LHHTALGVLLVRGGSLYHQAGDRGGVDTALRLLIGTVTLRQHPGDGRVANTALKPEDAMRGMIRVVRVCALSLPTPGAAVDMGLKAIMGRYHLRTPCGQTLPPVHRAAPVSS